MIRIIPFCIAAAVVVIVIGSLGRIVGGAARGVARDLRGSRRREPGAYEFDSRLDQAKRRAKGVRGPAEDREGMIAFIQSRTGVEAYLEPKTVAHPLSVVLVAGDGEWKRFELAEDSFIRALSKETGLPTFDAARVGYPQRMREYKRPRDDEKPA